MGRAGSPASFARDLLGIKIGERTAEVIKIKIGSILPFEDGRERDMIISGQDRSSKWLRKYFETARSA